MKKTHASHAKVTSGFVVGRISRVLTDEDEGSSASDEDDGRRARNGPYLDLRQDTGKEHRKCIKRELMIDSRDRDVVSYPSANRFDAFLGEKLKGVKSIELVSIIISVPMGFTDRYVVLVEDHCEDALMFADRVPFGYNTTLPGNVYKTGCSFPKGSLAMIQMIPNCFAASAVAWNSSNIGRGYKAKFRTDYTNVDRLSFSLWSWSITQVPTRFPLPNELPPPVVPDAANNVVMTLRMHYH